MKTNKWIAAVLAAAMLALTAVSATAATVVEKPTVTVAASAEVQAEPDIAYVSLGVNTENQKSDKAREENTKLMSKVIEAVKKVGVEVVRVAGVSTPMKATLAPPSSLMT